MQLPSDNQNLDTDGSVRIYATSQNDSEKCIYLISLLSALAIVLQIVESMIFPPQVIWFRIGLANCISIIAIYLVGISGAIYVVITRTVLASIFLGTFLSPPFVISFLSGIVSVLFMGVAKNVFKTFFSPIGISIIGAISHNLTQILVVVFMLGFGLDLMKYLLPVLLIGSLLAGFITGYVAKNVINKEEIKKAFSL